MRTDEDPGHVLADYSDRLLRAMQSSDQPAEHVAGFAKSVAHIAGVLLRHEYVCAWSISGSSTDQLLNRVQIDRFRIEAALSARGAELVAIGVSEDEAIDRWLDALLAQHRQLLAIDMEAYGVMTTSQESTEPRPRVVVLKGTVDFADGQKDDRFRHYSAFTSAEVMRAYVIQLLD